MPLETTECISIENKGRIYTDCMEFSLLRFLHLIGYCPNQMEQSKCSEFSKKVSTGLVGDFIKSHGTIYPDATYYLDEEKPGPVERAHWAEFVSDRSFLDYYRNDGAELFTSVTNIIKFFNGFYSMGLNVYTHESSLNKIAKHFSTKEKKITLTVISTDTKEETKPMSMIVRLISRPDNEIIGSSQLKKICICNTVIQIDINDDTYYWKLYEVYFKEKKFSNNWITGHSVINS